MRLARQHAIPLPSVLFFGPCSKTVCFPHSLPQPLSRPAGRKRGASFGRVFKADEFLADVNLSAVPTQLDECKLPTHNLTTQTPNCPNAQSSGYVPTLNTRPNMAVGSPFSPGGARKGLGDRVGETDAMNLLAVSACPISAIPYLTSNPRVRTFPNHHCRWPGLPWPSPWRPVWCSWKPQQAWRGRPRAIGLPRPGERRCHGARHP